jgi:hypothetical protein
MLSVTYAECHLCRVALMLSVPCKAYIPSVIMLNVVMLNVVMLNVVLLNVVAPNLAVGVSN